MAFYHVKENISYKETNYILLACIRRHYMDKKLFGRKLNMARKDRGLTSERLAELCDLNATYLRQIEAGTKVPSLPVFVLLCQKLNASPSYLLSEVFTGSNMQEMDVLFDLWQRATPSQIRIITAMVKSALEALEQ